MQITLAATLAAIVCMASAAPSSPVLEERTKLNTRDCIVRGRQQIIVLLNRTDTSPVYRHDQLLFPRLYLFLWWRTRRLLLLREPSSPPSLLGIYGLNYCTDAPFVSSSLEAAPRRHCISIQSASEEMTYLCSVWPSAGKTS